MHECFGFRSCWGARLIDIRTGINQANPDSSFRNFPIVSQVLIAHAAALTTEIAMTTARSHLIAREITPYYHLISRCVRRGFLCGRDRHSGQDYEHRRQWIVDRVALLTKAFAIDILAYAVMSNHYHLVVQIQPDLAKDWDNDQVMARWRRIFRLPLLLDRYQAGFTGAAEQPAVDAAIDLLRQRLSSVSWFMKCMNEYISRRANREDNCKGAFWESRFKSHALLDEKALVSCMVYVDLNPIRAGIADTPETSDYTSVQARISGKSAIDLAPFGFSNNERPTRSPVPFTSLPEYLALVDWTGRVVVRGKRGSLSCDVPPILERLRFDQRQWASSMKAHARPPLMIGAVSRLAAAASEAGRNWFRGSSEMLSAFG